MPVSANSHGMRHKNKRKNQHTFVIPKDGSQYDLPYIRSTRMIYGGEMSEGTSGGNM